MKNLLNTTSGGECTWYCSDNDSIQVNMRFAKMCSALSLIHIGRRREGALWARQQLLCSFFLVVYFFLFCKQTAKSLKWVFRSLAVVYARYSLSLLHSLFYLPSFARLERGVHLWIFHHAISLADNHNSDSWVRKLPRRPGVCCCQTMSQSSAAQRSTGSKLNR